MTDPDSSPRRLLLFDIDGTLLTTGGAGEHGFSEAFAACFGVDDNLATIDFAGATDTGIVGMLFDKHGLPPTPENHAKFHAAYLPRLEANLARFPGRLMPGVPELLADLRAVAPEHGLMLGLLTGNFRAAAELKLSRYGLHHFFDWERSAFADDQADRNQLGPAALRRARDLHGAGAFPDHARDVLVLGDTLRDIGCARACGASVLAVATGRHDRATLAAAEPDFLFNTLADPGVREVLLR